MQDQRHEAYVSEIKQLFASGSREMLVVPLDYKMLELLPDEGTNVGGLYQIGATVREVSEKLGSVLPSSALNARIRVLHILDLVTPVRALGQNSARAWQKTKAGKEELETWQASL